MVPNCLKFVLKKFKIRKNHNMVSKLGWQKIKKIQKYFLHELPTKNRDLMTYKIYVCVGCHFVELL